MTLTAYVGKRYISVRTPGAPTWRRRPYRRWALPPHLAADSASLEYLTEVLGLRDHLLRERLPDPSNPRRFRYPVTAPDVA
jgi:hypothetical protein